MFRAHVCYRSPRRLLALTLPASTLLIGLAASACAAGWTHERSAPASTAAGAEHPEDHAAMERTITSVGSGVSSRAPDHAEVRLGAVAIGKTAAEAQDALNKTMSNVIRAVKGLNLEGMQVQSEWVNLSPRYERRSRGEDNEEPKIVGYQASSSVVVKINQVDKTGPVIDAGIAAGANQVNGINLSLKNDKDARREAIAQAAQDARDKAMAAASALNLRIVGIRAVQTDRAEVRPIFRAGLEMSMMSRSADSGSATPIEAGEVALTAEVTVVFHVVQIEAP